MPRLGLTCPLYLTQNDGTLMTAAHAETFPIFSLTSGPTNSMRGASFLTGLADAIVVDIGGTTTDVGILVNGFPRARGEGAEIAGVRTNFRVPDVMSIGLGGGSLVRGAHKRVTIGPDSVGYRLTPSCAGLWRHRTYRHRYRRGGRALRSGQQDGACGA